MVEFGDIKMQSCQVALDGPESPIDFHWGPREYPG